ncbi:MAG: RNA-guided pseudouridylation complex pseudouridine synthase subunit Cbf5 [Candidatus Woesearchaeota archaeon]
MQSLPFEKRRAKLLEKKHAETNPDYGCSPEKRATGILVNYGIINLNKPAGPTSHQVSDYIQKILHIEKAGHSGTLDPGVTGVLPVALGRATRIVQMLLTAGKEYVGVMHLHDEVPTKELEAAIKKFVGKITQLPPLRSAIKRQMRQREVYYFEVLEVQGKDILFKVGCEAGTYIRKLCHDIGIALKTGAHMAALHRTKAGQFTDEDYVTLQDLEDAYWYWKNENNDKLLRHCIKPVEFGVSHLSKVYVQDSAVDTICHGASLKVPGIVKLDSDVAKGSTVAIMTLKGELIALGEAQLNAEDILKAERGEAVKTHKVFMLAGTYPKPITL